MSTKTSIKRIAAVAALALTLGGFSAVSAHASTGATVTAIGSTGSTVGVGATVATTFSGSAGTSDTGGLTVTLTVPATSTVTLADRDGAFSSATTSVFSAMSSATYTSAVMSTSTGAVTFSAPNSAITGAAVGNLTIIPDVAGTYTVTIAGNSTTKTETITTVSAATFVGGTGSTVTSASAIKQITGGVATYNIVSNATDTSYQVSVSGQTILSAFTTTSTPYSLSSAGAFPALLTSGSTGLTYANGSTPQGGFTFTPGANAGSAYLQIQVQSLTAGTGTLTVTPLNASGVPGIPVTSTTTWGAAAVLAPALSTAYMADSVTTGTATTNAVPRSATKTAGTALSQITVTLKKSDATDDTNGDKVSASISGSGFVLVDETNGVGTLAATNNRTSSSSVAQSVHYVHVATDGTAGVGTITVSVTDAVALTTTVLGTFTVTSYGSATALAVTANYTIGKIGGYTTGAASGNRYKDSELVNPLEHTTANASGETSDGSAALLGTSVPAFTVKVTDSAGNLVNLASAGVLINPTVSSSDLTVISSGSCVRDLGNSSTYSTGAGVGYYNCSFTTAPLSVSGGKAILTIKTPNPADTTTNLTTTLNVTVGGKVAKTVVAFDSSSYNAGQALNVTETATDSAGNPVYDGAASAALSSSKALGGDALGNFTGWYTAGTDSLAASVAKSTSYAPSLGGDFVITGTDSALNALSATATVTTVGDAAAQAAVDAANEATDAANAATDAANNAMDSADAAQQAALDAGDKADAALAAVTDLATKVSAIATQIASLSALVKKIAAKVKA